MATASERKRAQVERYKLAGLLSVTVWVRPESTAAIRQLAHDLNQAPPAPAAAPAPRWRPRRQP
jgi:hypothetical protein